MPKHRILFDVQIARTVAKSKRKMPMVKKLSFDKRSKNKLFVTTLQNLSFLWSFDPMQSMPMGVLKSWWQPNTHLTQAFANNLSFQGKKT